MPQLTAITEANRVNLALEVWMLLEANPRLTQKAACEAVGISTFQYRKWIAESDSVLDEFRSAHMGIQRFELMRVLAARERILSQLIRDALNPFTDPAIRLEILKWTHELTDRLMDTVHATDSGRADFLTGPELVEAESKFSASEVEINLKLKSPNIIDVTPAGHPALLTDKEEEGHYDPSPDPDD